MAANALNFSNDLGLTWSPITSGFLNSDIQSVTFNK
jgi:hypothetical protein